MADPINLNRVRKKKRAAEKEKIAGENRAKFGRTKAEKMREAAERALQENTLDSHRRDRED